MHLSSFNSAISIPNCFLDHRICFFVFFYCFMEWPQKIIRIWKLIISPIFLKCKHCLSLMHLPIRNWTVSNPNYCLDLSVIHASVQLQLSHFNSKLLPGSSHLLLRFFLNFFMEWPQKIIRIWKLIISPIFLKCKHCLSLMHLPIRNWTVSNPNYCLDLSVIHASVQLQLSHFNSKLLPGSSHLLLRFFLIVSWSDPRRL